MKALLALAAAALTLAGCVVPPPDYGRDSGRGSHQFERGRDGDRDRDRDHEHDRDRGQDGHEDQGSMRPGPGSGYGGRDPYYGGRSRGY